jgi:hypothetical protein
MAAGHYAARAWQARRRAANYWCSGLAAALLLIFAPWPGNLWGEHNTGPGNFTQGLIWDGPYSPVKLYVAKGDLPAFKEYHWTALQDLAGNAYILVGLALLILLAVVAFRSRSRSRQDRAIPPDATEQASTGAVARPA